MGVVGDLKAVLRGSNEGLNATVKDARDQIKLMKEEADRASKSFRDLGVVGGAAFAALAAATTIQVKASIDLAAAMAAVATMIPGQTARIQELKREVQSLAVEVGKSTNDLAQGLYNVLSAFGDSADAVQKLEITAKAATAGVSATGEALSFLSAVTKAYGDTSAEAMEKVADLGFQTVNLGDTTFPALAAAIGGVTPQAVTLGVSLEELFGVMATATGVTGGTSEVVTQLARVFDSLMNPTETMIGLFKSLGVASGQAMIAQYGLQGAINAVISAHKASGIQLRDFIGSTRGQTLALALAGAQAEDLTRKTDEMYSAQGAMEAAFREQTKGVNAFGFALEQLKAQLGALNQTMGDANKPSAEMVDFLRSLVAQTTEVVKANPQLVRALTASALAMTGLTAATVAFVALKPLLLGAWGALMGPMGVAVLAAGALAAALGALTGRQKETAKQSFEVAKQTRDEADQLDKLIKRYRDLEGKPDKSAKEHGELRSVIDQIVKLAPSAVTGYNEMGQAILGTGERAATAAEQMRKLSEAQMQALENEAKMKLPGLTAERNRAQAVLNKATDEQSRLMQELAEASGPVKLVLQNQLNIVSGTVRDYLNKLNEINEQIEQYESVLEGIKKVRSGDTGEKPGGKPEGTDLGDGVATDTENKALRAKLDLFDDLKSKNEEIVNTYQKQAEWLQKNILDVEGIIRKTSEKAQIEDMIYRLMRTRYEVEAEKGQWTAAQKLKNLDAYVKAYAKSTDHFLELDLMRIRLNAQAAEDEARARDKAFDAAMDQYAKRTQGLKLSTEEQKRIYVDTMNELLAVDKRSAEAKAAIAHQLVLFDRQMGQERLEAEEKRAAAEVEINIRALRNSGQEMKARIEEIKQSYESLLKDAAGNAELYEKVQGEMLREIGQVYDEFAEKRKEHEDKMDAIYFEDWKSSLRNRIEALEREREEELKLADETGASKVKVNLAYDALIRRAEAEAAAERLRITRELNAALYEANGESMEAELEQERARYEAYLRDNELTTKQEEDALAVHNKNLAAIQKKYRDEAHALAAKAHEDLAALNQSALDAEIAAIRARGEEQKDAIKEAAKAAGTETSVETLQAIAAVEQRVKEEIDEANRRASTEAQIAQAELDAEWLAAIGLAEDAALESLRAGWLRQREERRDNQDALFKIDMAYYAKQADVRAQFADERLRKEQEAADALLELHLATLEAQGKADQAARDGLAAERDKKLRERPEGVDMPAWEAQVTGWYTAELEKVDRESAEKRAQAIAEANDLLAAAMAEGLKSQLLTIAEARDAALKAAGDVPEAIDAINQAYDELALDAIATWAEAQAEETRKFAEEQKKYAEDRAKFAEELAESIADIYRTAEEQAIAELDRREKDEKDAAARLGLGALELEESLSEITSKYETLRQQTREKFRMEHLVSMTSYNADILRAQGKAKEAELADLDAWWIREAEGVRGNKELEEKLTVTYATRRQEIIDRYNAEWLKQEQEAARELELVQMEGLDRRLADLDDAMRAELEGVDANSQAAADIKKKYDILKGQEETRYNQEREVAQAEMQARLLQAQGKFEEAAIASEEARYLAELYSQEWSEAEKESLLKIHEANKADIAAEYAARRAAIEQQYAQQLEQLGMTSRQKELARIKEQEKAALEEARKAGADEVKIRQYFAELKNQVDERYEKARKKRLEDWRAELSELQGATYTARMAREVASFSAIESDPDLSPEEKEAARKVHEEKMRQIVRESLQAEMQLRRDFGAATLADEIAFYEKQLDGLGEGTDEYIRIQTKLRALREEQADHSQRMANIIHEATIAEIEAEDELAGSIERVHFQRDQALRDETLTEEARAAIIKQYALEEEKIRDQYRKTHADDLERWTEDYVGHQMSMGRATKQNLVDALKEVKRINDERGENTEALARKIQLLEKEIADDTIFQAHRVEDALREVEIRRLEVAGNTEEAQIARAKLQLDQKLRDPNLAAEERAAAEELYQLEIEQIRKEARKREADDLESWTETYIGHQVAMGKATKQNLLDALKEVKRINDERGEDTEALARRIQLLEKEIADDAVAEAHRVEDAIRGLAALCLETEDEVAGAIARADLRRDQALRAEGLTAAERTAIELQHQREVEQIEADARDKRASELEQWTDTFMGHEMAMGRATKENLLAALKTVKEINDGRDANTEALARRIELLEKEIADDAIAQAQRAQDALREIGIRRLEMEDQVAAAMARAELRREQALRDAKDNAQLRLAIEQEYWLEVEQIERNAEQRRAIETASWTEGYMEHEMAMGRATKEELLETLKALRAMYQDEEMDTEELRRKIERLQKEIADDAIALKEQALAYYRATSALGIEAEIEYWRERIKAAKTGTDEYYALLSKLYSLETQAAEERWRTDSDLSYRQRQNAMAQVTAELAALDMSVSGWEARAAALRDLLKKFREDEEKQVKDWIKDLAETGLRELGNQLQDLGGLGGPLGVFVSSLEVEVKGLANGIRAARLEVKNWEEALISLAQYGVGKLAEAFGRLFKGLGAEGDKWGKSSFLDLDKMIKTWEQWDELNKQLKDKQATQIGTTIGGGLAGGLLGFFLGGPLGALIGAGIGAAIGDAVGSTLDKDIEKLKEELKTTFEDIKEALGTTIGDLAGALDSAFSAHTYEQFVYEFSSSLEDMTKQALIKAFLAGEIMRPLLDQLSDTITLAILDAELTPEEIAEIKRQKDKISETAGEFWEVIKELFPAFGAGPFDGGASPGGVSISEFTGPTRDLLTQLLRPLGEMPNFFAGVHDILVDIRDILRGSYPLPPAGFAEASAPGGYGIYVAQMTVEAPNADLATMEKFSRMIGNAVKQRRQATGVEA